MVDHASVKSLQRGELAKRTGCNLETVRYYEKVRLMPEPPRTVGGYRTYDTTHERRLRFTLRARELGFTLDEVRELLRLADEREAQCAEGTRPDCPLMEALFREKRLSQPCQRYGSLPVKTGHRGPPRTFRLSAITSH